MMAKDFSLGPQYHQQVRWTDKGDRVNCLSVVECRNADWGEDEDCYSLSSYNTLLNYYEGASPPPPPTPSASPADNLIRRDGISDDDIDQDNFVYTHSNPKLTKSLDKDVVRSQESKPKNHSKRQQMSLRNPIIAVQIDGLGKLANKRYGNYQNRQPKGGPTNSPNKSLDYDKNRYPEDPFTRGMACTSLEDLQEYFPPPLVSCPTTTSPVNPPSFVPVVQSILDTPPVSAHKRHSGKVNGIDSDMDAKSQYQKTTTPADFHHDNIFNDPHSVQDPDHLSSNFYYKFYTRAEMTEMDRQKLDYHPHVTPVVRKVDEESGRMTKPAPRWKSATKMREMAHHLADMSLQYRSSTACTMDTDLLRGTSSMFRTPTTMDYNKSHTTIPVCRPATTMPTSSTPKLIALKDDETTSILGTSKKPRGQSAPNTKLKTKRNVSSQQSTFVEQNYRRPSFKTSFSTKPGVKPPQNFLNLSPSNQLLEVYTIDDCHPEMRGRSNSAHQQTNGGLRNISSSAGSVASGHVISRQKSANLPGINKEECVAARHFERRNQFLREQMEIYIQWKTSEQSRERYELARREDFHPMTSSFADGSVPTSGKKSESDKRPRFLTSSKETRLRMFNQVLRQQELEYARVMEIQAREEMEKQQEIERAEDEDNELQDEREISASGSEAGNSISSNEDTHEE